MAASDAAAWEVTARGVTAREVGPREVAAWVQAAADGDRQAWGRLVDRFSGLVWSIARAYRLGSADAEEVYQTAWLRLVENLSRIQEPAQVGAWLATTARREAMRLARRGGRVTVTADPELLDPGSLDESPEQAVLTAEASAAAADHRRQLWSAFRQLPERCRELLSMLVVISPPLSYQEVSAVLGIAVGSIGPIRARCLGQLRIRLAAAGAEG